MPPWYRQWHQQHHYQQHLIDAPYFRYTPYQRDTPLDVMSENNDELLFPVVMVINSTIGNMIYHQVCDF